MKNKSKSRRNFILITVAYIIGNITLFFINPFASSWHYHTHKPVPIPVTQQHDINLSVNDITKILDEIDLVYRSRERTSAEQAKYTAMSVVSYIFFPASFALQMKEFIGYIGPANEEQQAFTISVKRRYNHLAILALSKGMKRDGYLFVEEPSLSKQKGESFRSLRSYSPD